MPSISSLVSAPPSRPLLTSVIVDDEQQSRGNLAFLLQTYCPEIEVIAEAPTVETAMRVIKDRRPDVLFLDIEMRKESGFDLLESIEGRDFLVVFVTAHNNYGVKAIKASAVDYLLKPVSIDELREAVDRLLALHHRRELAPDSTDIYQEALAELVNSLRGGSFPQKIVLPTSEGLIVEELGNIIRLESDNYYTTIIRHGAPNIFLAKTLKEFELALEERMFVRVHNSHIINMAYLQKFDKRDGGYVVMADGSKIPVSRRRQGLLLEKLNVYRRV